MPSSKVRRKSAEPVKERGAGRLRKFSPSPCRMKLLEPVCRRDASKMRAQRKALLLVNCAISIHAAIHDVHINLTALALEKVLGRGFGGMPRRDCTFAARNFFLQP